MELDAVGRPLTVTADGWRESYAYDQAGNQTEATWPEKAGRAEARGERTYTGTRVKTAGHVRYEHDAAGRMVLRQKHRLSKKPDTWRYEWDAEDRLTSCTTPDGTLWRYTYDPLGRRTAKYRMHADGSVAEAMHFTWDGTRLAEQTDTATGVTLTWEHEDHRPLTQLERKPRTADGRTTAEWDSRFFAIVTDLVGTPTELVDEQGGIAWYSRTTLWGTTTRNRDATATTPSASPASTPTTKPASTTTTSATTTPRRDATPRRTRWGWSRHPTPSPMSTTPGRRQTPWVWLPLLQLQPASQAQDGDGGPERL